MSTHIRTFKHKSNFLSYAPDNRRCSEVFSPMDGLHTVDLDAGIMALHQASASSEQARMLSTRPRRKRRIDALSYVDTRRPWTLRKTAKSSALLAGSIYASSSRVTADVRCNTFASVRIYPSGKSEILTAGASSRTTLLGGGVLAHLRNRKVYKNNKNFSHLPRVRHRASLVVSKPYPLHITFQRLIIASLL